MALPEFYFSVVCKYLNPKDLSQLSQVCKLYKNLYQPLKFEVTEKGTYLSENQSNASLLPYAGLNKNTKLILSDVPHVLYGIDHAIEERINEIVLGYCDEYDVYILSKFYGFSLEEIETMLPGVVNSRFVERVEVVKINKRCEFPKANEIHVHDGVKSLPKSAFKNCVDLECVDISDVMKLSIRLFEGCENLKEVKLNKRVSCIPDHCFSGCKNLKKINLDDIVSIGDHAFYGCKNLEDVGSLLNVKKLGDYAFGYCKSLKHVEVKCEEIPKCCFCDAGIEYIDLSSVKTLGWKSFTYCNIKRITLGKELKKIPECCFSDSRLEEIDLSDIEKIDMGAFMNCHDLKAVRLGKNIKHIPMYCFHGSWIDVINLDDVEKFERHAFSGCTFRTVTLNEHIKHIPEYCFSGTNLEEIDLSNVEKIDRSAFSCCRNLKTVNLGEKIKYIPANCFDTCVSLTSINLNDDVEVHNLAFRKCISLK